MKLHICATHSTILKHMMQIMKNISNDICFYMKTDSIYLQSTDETMNVLYDITLTKEFFDLYEYKPLEDDAELALNTKMLHTALSYIEADEYIQMATNKQKDKLQIHIFKANGTKHTEFVLPIMNNQETNLLNVVIQEYSVDLKMNAKEFFEIAHNHTQIGDVITIKCTDSAMTFTTKGLIQKTSFLNVSEIKEYSIEEDYYYHKSFHTKHIEKVAQFHKICDIMEAHMDDDGPLYLKYEFGRCNATLRIFIAPMIETEIIDENDEMMVELVSEEIENIEMI